MLSLTGPRAFSEISFSWLFPVSRVTKKSSSILTWCFFISMMACFMGSIYSIVLSLIILTSLKWVITCMRVAFSEAVSALLGTTLIPSVTSWMKWLMFLIYCIVLLRMKLVWVWIHASIVFSSSLIKGIELTLSQPMSTEVFISAIWRLTVVRCEIFSSKISRVGNLVTTPFKIF